MKPSVDDIDALLPQTQCGLCDYSGCRPYAAAIVAKEATIDRCPPGGVETLVALATQLSIDPTPFLQDMQEKTKSPTVAFIREEACIGCTKCIQACPTDAILGTHKKMHTIMTDACTGCELCVAPCPVDCIDLLPIEKISAEQQKTKADQWRERYVQRNTRLQQLECAQPETPIPSVQSRQSAIAAALQRARAKKDSHEYSEN